MKLVPQNMQTDMPFTLFTPLGKITGYYSTHFKLFKYIIENRSDIFKKIEGLFGVDKYGEAHNRKYHISSYLTLEDLKDNCINLSFNNMTSNYVVKILKTGNTRHEEVRLYFGGGNIEISHFYYPSFNNKQELARIKMKIETGSNILPINFEFGNKDIYSKSINMGDEYFSFKPFWKKIEQIDFKVFSEEIAVNDPKMFEFIDEVRKDLTMLANGVTPICIYDKLAQLCFYDKSDSLQLAFSRAEDVNTALTYNRVLKKLNRVNSNTVN